MHDTSINMDFQQVGFFFFFTRSFAKVSWTKKAATGQEWKWSYELMINSKKDTKQTVGVSKQFSQSLVKGDHK